PKSRPSRPHRSLRQNDPGVRRSHSATREQQPRSRRCHRQKAGCCPTAARKGQGAGQGRGHWRNGGLECPTLVDGIPRVLLLCRLDRNPLLLEFLQLDRRVEPPVHVMVPLELPRLKILREVILADPTLNGTSFWLARACSCP